MGPLFSSQNYFFNFLTQIFFKKLSKNSKNFQKIGGYHVTVLGYSEVRVPPCTYVGVLGGTRTSEYPNITPSPQA